MNKEEVYRYKEDNREYIVYRTIPESKHIYKTLYICFNSEDFLGKSCMVQYAVIDAGKNYYTMIMALIDDNLKKGK